MSQHEDRLPGWDDPDFGDVLRDTAPLTIGEWDDLLASEQAATAEPFDGRTWTGS